MSTVIVHTINSPDDHAIWAFPEVSVTTERPRDDFYFSTLTPPSRGRDIVYTISGSEGSLITHGDSVEMALLKVVEHQADEASKLRRDRDVAREELERLRSDLRRLVDPPVMPEGDNEADDEDDHDWGTGW